MTLPTAQLLDDDCARRESVLALRLLRPNPEDDLVPGLLRDIGVLALQQVYPAEHAQLRAASNRQRSRNLIRLVTLLTCAAKRITIA